MQIKLCPDNESGIKKLVRIYGKICPEYDLSPTYQCNLLLRGRIKVALLEAMKELKKNPCKGCK